MQIQFIEKDQVRQEEKTNYWFNVDGDDWAISDSCGELTLLDCDGCPCTHNYPEVFAALSEKYKAHI